MSAQIDFDAACREQGLLARTVMNHYDALYVDCPLEELRPVRKLLQSCMTCPQYLVDLQSLLGREVPWKADFTIVRKTIGGHGLSE